MGVFFRILTIAIRRRRQSLPAGIGRLDKACPDWSETERRGGARER